MIKAIIFDVGGVIILGFEGHYGNIVNKLSVNAAKFNEVKNRYADEARKGSISKDEFLRNIASGIDVSKEQLLSAWSKSMRETMFTNKPIIKLIKKLNKNRYKTAALTNANPVNSDFGRKLGIYKEFGAAIISNEVGLIKPDPKIYKLTLKILKTKPNESVFIDDERKNITPAKKLGFKTILFKDAKQLETELKSLGVKV